MSYTIYEKLFNLKKNFSLKNYLRLHIEYALIWHSIDYLQRIDYTTGKFHEEIYLTIDKLLKNYPIIEEIVLIKHKKIDELEEIYTKQLIKNIKKSLILLTSQNLILKQFMKSIQNLILLSGCVVMEL